MNTALYKTNEGLTDEQHENLGLRAERVIYKLQRALQFGYDMKSSRHINIVEAMVLLQDTIEGLEQ